MCVRKISAQCVLQFTPSLAAGCVLHRPVSRVIHCSELYFIVCIKGLDSWVRSPGKGETGGTLLFYGNLDRAFAPNRRNEGSSEPREKPPGPSGTSRRDVPRLGVLFEPSVATPFRRRAGGEQAPHEFRRTLSAFDCVRVWTSTGCSGRPESSCSRSPGRERKR